MSDSTSSSIDQCDHADFPSGAGVRDNSSSLSLRTAFFKLYASADMDPSKSTFHRLRSLDIAQPKRSWDAKTPSAVVCCRDISSRNDSLLFRTLASKRVSKKGVGGAKHKRLLGNEVRPSNSRPFGFTQGDMERSG